MSLDDAHIAALVGDAAEPGLDPRYAAYFRLFDQQRHYDAHDVLESLWLPIRREAHGDFYKALIQLAGAFVHLQKGRLPPAATLLRLARGRLSRFGDRCERLDLRRTCALADRWLALLEAGPPANNPWSPATAPRLELLPREEAPQR